jgi:prepilin-type processing-associated H-X9-DG protein
MNEIHRFRRVVAFSLVELLVVMGIIALLISILLPSLNRARAQSMSTQCKSNLRQLGIAWLNYAANNKGRVFIGSTVNQSISQFWWAGSDGTVSPPVDHREWGLLYPYMPDGGVRDCPAAAGLSSSLGLDDSAPLAYGSSAGVHNSKFPLGVLNSGNFTLILTKVQIPTETVWWADSATLRPTNATDNGLTRMGYLGPPKPVVFPDVAACFHGRHLKRGNVLWMDGHVTDEPPNFSNTSVVLGSTQSQRTMMSLGDLMPPGVNYGDPLQNYYFWKDKRTQADY